MWLAALTAKQECFATLFATSTLSVEADVAQFAFGDEVETFFRCHIFEVRTGVEVMLSFAARTFVLLAFCGDERVPLLRSF